MKYLLEVNEYLSIIEEVFKKYMDIDHDLLLFIKYERYPVLDKKLLSKIKDNSLISKTPFVPYLCVGCVRDMLLDYIYMDSSRDSSFKVNPFLPDGGRKDLVPDFDNNETIIRSYVENISDEDIDIIIKWVNKLYNENIKQIVKQYPDCIFDIDIDTSSFVLLNLGDIKVFRYNELLEFSKNNNSDSCYKDDVNIDDFNRFDGNECRKVVFKNKRKNKDVRWNQKIY